MANGTKIGEQYNAVTGKRARARAEQTMAASGATAYLTVNGGCNTMGIPRSVPGIVRSRRRQCSGLPEMLAGIGATGTMVTELSATETGKGPVPDQSHDRDDIHPT